MRFLPIAILATTAVLHVETASAQISSLADDIFLLSKGVQAQENARADTHLGGIIGGRESTLGANAGGRESRITGLLAPGASTAVSATENRDVLSAISNEGQPARRPQELRLAPRQELPAPTVPVYGQLEVPEAEEEGPQDGLTLDMAIERLVRSNVDLRTKALEIPQARADVLTASLRANPLAFANASSVPYGSYSPDRPGANGYSATVIYPFDVSRKRLSRTDVASRAQRVLEAQYQDAVRLEMDNLYSVYVDLIAARETLRYSQASQAGLQAIAKLVDAQLKGSTVPRPDLERALIQSDLAEIGLEQSHLALRQAKQNLATILNYSLDSADGIEPRGTLRDREPLPETRDELCAIALRSRPDLIAYRLGVHRAQADVRLAQAEKTSDVFLLYSPWEFENNVPTGGQNSTSWSIGAFTSVPLFNRNQGNIRRAQVNVSQTRTELAGLERQVLAEVDRTYAEYTASRDATARLEEVVLPRSKRIRDLTAGLLKQGEVSAVEYLNAQKDYNEVVRQYRDALIRHRRSMLRLNTVVGERILP
jgi:cobalt-zinc-cadmium efflux system outer membrane protein